MSRTYPNTAPRRLINVLVRTLLRLGLMPRPYYLLTTVGRRTGQPHTTPVELVEAGDQRWLVAPYGETDWVRNARAAGWVTLSRGRRSERVRITELDIGERAPILRTYLRNMPIVRPFFEASPDAPLDAFTAEAVRHPVFRIDGPVDGNEGTGPARKSRAGFASRD